MERRHDALIPLSHHHYHGLFVSLKLQNANKENGRWTTEEIWKDSKDFWENGGEAHFREEEEILFPTFAQYYEIEDLPEISKGLLEHVKIRSMFDQLINKKSDDCITLMHTLGKLLKDHIRMEERVIFPLIQKVVPNEVLMKISPHFDAHEEIYTK